MSKNKNPETIALHGGDYRSDPSTTAVAVKSGAFWPTRRHSAVMI